MAIINLTSVRKTRDRRLRQEVSHGKRRKGNRNGAQYRYINETNSALVYIDCTVLITRVDLLYNRSVFNFFCSAISTKKVPVILTVASFCLAVLTVASPIVESPEFEMGGIGDGMEYIDVKWFVNSIKAMDKKHEIRNGFSELEEEEVEFVALSMKKLQKHGLVRKLVYEMLIASRSQDEFERSIDNLESSEESEAVLAESVKVSGEVEDS